MTIWNEGKEWGERGNKETTARMRENERGKRERRGKKPPFIVGQVTVGRGTWL